MLSSKNRRTLAAIFAQPTPADIRWADIETLLLAIGAERSEGRGSRVRFFLDGQILTVHRPHPSPQTKRYAVRDVRDFLKAAGFDP